MIITNFTREEIQELERYHKYFKAHMYFELVKVSKFFKAKLDECFEKWKLILINAALLKSGNIEKTYEKKRKILKEAFHNFYKELKLLEEFLKINFEAFRKVNPILFIQPFNKFYIGVCILKILKKHKKYVQPFYTSNIDEKFSKIVEMSNIRDQKNGLRKLDEYVEDKYLNLFYKKYNRKEGVIELRLLTQNISIRPKRFFFFGFFLGFTIFSLITIITLIENGGFGLEDKHFKTIFPQFRGIAIFIAYVWLLAWNVYGWTTYHINYKLIFGIKYEYSRFTDIMGRATFFSSVFLIMFLWFLILISVPGSSIAQFLDFLPEELTPLIVWIVFFGYLFFPYFGIFNGFGRKFMLKVFGEIIRSCFFLYPITFRVAWATDQLVSFAIPLRDTAYIICFIANYIAKNVGNNASDFCSTKYNTLIAFIIAVIPLLMRLIQVLRQIYDFRTLRPYIYNFGKYLTAAGASILSYLVTLTSYQEVTLILWIIVAGLSTLYSYFWDLKYDWNFLQANTKHKFLRSSLAYDKTIWYYIAIGTNLILRVSWTLTISPNVVSRILRLELITLITGFLEIFRRAMWNFLRIERDHVINVGAFRAVEPLRLPFDENGYEIDPSAKFKFMEDCKKKHSERFYHLTRPNIIPEVPKPPKISDEIPAHDFREDLPTLKKRMSSRPAPSYSHLLNEISSTTLYYLQNDVPFSPSSLKKLTIPDYPVKEWMKEASASRIQIKNNAKRRITIENNSNNRSRQNIPGSRKEISEPNDDKLFESNAPIIKIVHHREPSNYPFLVSKNKNGQPSNEVSTFSGITKPIHSEINST